MSSGLSYEETQFIEARLAHTTGRITIYCITLLIWFLMTDLHIEDIYSKQLNMQNNTAEIELQKYAMQHNFCANWNNTVRTWVPCDLINRIPPYLLRK